VVEISSNISEEADSLYPEPSERATSPINSERATSPTNSERAASPANSTRAASPANTERAETPAASPDGNAEPEEEATMSSSPRYPLPKNLFADIEHLLGETSSDSEEENPAKEVKKIEKRIKTSEKRWNGRGARTSLHLAVSNILDAQADLTRCEDYDDLRPRFVDIREKINLLAADIKRKMEDMWKE
jgi:hypothetical protein